MNFYFYSFHHSSFIANQLILIEHRKLWLGTRSRLPFELIINYRWWFFFCCVYDHLMRVHVNNNACFIDASAPTSPALNISFKAFSYQFFERKWNQPLSKSAAIGRCARLVFTLFSLTLKIALGFSTTTTTTTSKQNERKKKVNPFSLSPSTLIYFQMISMNETKYGRYRLK